MIKQARTLIALCVLATSVEAIWLPAQAAPGARSTGASLPAATRSPDVDPPSLPALPDLPVAPGDIVDGATRPSPPAAPAQSDPRAPAPAPSRDGSDPPATQSGSAAGLASATSPTPQQSGTPAAEGRTRLSYVPGELLVKFRPRVARARRSEIRAASGARLKRTLAVPGLELLKLEQTPVRAAEAALEKRAEIAYAEPNFIYRASSTTPDDARFNSLWGLHNTGTNVAGYNDADIDAPEAWDLATGSDSATVAVVDTGVALDHSELAASIWRNPGETSAGRESNGVDDDGNGLVDDWRGWDWVAGDNDPYDMHGHGTHVAGTIGAKGNDGTGVVGVNWDVTMMPLRVLDSQGFGVNSDITEAFAYAGGKGAQVVNASLGGAGYSQAQADAIAAAPNTLFVVAAGNAASDNDASPTYPCNYSAANVVCVAATDSYDALASFSNFGASSVHLAAPGVSILSSIPPPRTVLFSEGFDGDFLTRWSTGGTNNSWGIGVDEVGPYLTDSPVGNYLDNTDSWVQPSQAFDLSAKRRCTLDYWALVATESSNDSLRVEASTDGTTWTELSRWSGAWPGWRSMSDDLSAFDGAPRVHVRFHLVSNGAATSDGVRVDDVELACSSAYTGSEYASFSGTSMATPHVAGAAALLWSYAPGASLAAVRSALLEGVDGRSSLNAKTATGGRLNAFNSVALVGPFAGDSTPPSAVSVGGAAVSSPFVRAKSFAVSLAASDASGIAHYSVRRREAPFDGAFGAYRLFQTTSSYFTVSGTPGRTYCFAVAATDRAGNSSAYSPEKCTAVPLNNTQMTHRGSWSKRTGPGYYLNSYSLSYRRGAELVKTGVRARRLAVIVTRCRGCGTAAVLFNGVLLKKIGLGSSVTRKRQLVWVTTFGAVRTGTVRVRVISAGKPVKIEGVGTTRA